MSNRVLILVTVFPLLVLISAVQSARGAVTEAWVQRYNNVVSNSWDGAFVVAIDPAGDVIMAGFSEDGSGRPETIAGGVLGGDMIAIKYSGVDGSVIWQKRHHKPNYTVLVSGIATDSQGNVVVNGYSLYGDLVTYTAKYAAADGAVLWENITPADTPPSVMAVDANDNVVVAYNNITIYDGATGSTLRTVETTDNWTSIALDDSGNIIVSGSSTAKYATDGSLLWRQSFGGAAIAVDGSGNVVVMGGNYYTAKYAAADGTLLWERQYTWPPGISQTARALTVDAAGNVIVTGDSATVKYAANGAFIWDKRYPIRGVPKGVAVDADGNVLVAGGARAQDEDYPFRYYLTKYAAANGTVLWEKFETRGGPAAVARGDGSIVMVGTSRTGNLYDDAYTVKYDVVDGTLVWEQRYNVLANNPDLAAAVAIDAEGNVAVTGESIGNEGNPDYYTVKYVGTTGTRLWEKRYNSPGNGTDRATAIAVDQGGNVIVTGYAWNGTNWDWATMKYAAADGALLWERRHDGPGNGGDTAYAVAVDGSGNVVVTGDSSGTAGERNFYTAKYAAADGALLWERRYNRLTSDYDSARAVAIDRDGNVVVTGFIAVAGRFDYHYDYYTAKYAAADGALLWENRSGSDRHDHAYAVAVDSSGNVVVTGSSNDDYYTIKFAATDGRLLWDKRYSGPGPGNGWDSAQAVAIDGNDNVIVTGYSRSATTNRSDYYTAKYAATDGTLLWEKRYDSPGSGSDSATAVAVDGGGNVVVTGTSAGDYYTAKYGATSGALFWERRYNGPANQTDSAAKLAISRNGMVVVTGAADSYSASDVVGRSDYLTIAYRDDSPSVSIERISTGLRVRMNGLAGRTYEVQRAGNVDGPWSTIATVTAPGSGLIEFVEATPPTGSLFYRTRTE
jgi:uncharacterized delta-60 repeat protein